MPMVRTIRCDMCGTMEPEKDYGVGWSGWSIVQGIAAVKPLPGAPLNNENMSSSYCPRCTEDLAVFISYKQKERLGIVGA